MKEKINFVFNEAKVFLSTLVKSSKFKAFCWQTLNGFITVLITIVADMPWAYAPFIQATLNLITKYINKTYL